MSESNKHNFCNPVSGIKLFRTNNHLAVKRVETRPQSGISSWQWGLMFGLMSVITSECFGQISIGGFEIPSPPGVDVSLPDINLPNVPGIELGHKTNKWDVRHDLENDGWWVAYGKEIGYEEYYVFIQAVEASVASRNPAPAMAYLQFVIEESVRTLAVNAGQEFGGRLRTIAHQHLVNAMYDAIENGRINTFQLDGLDVQLGMATYNRSESGVPLPNTFQPYLRMRVRGIPENGTGVGGAVTNAAFQTGAVLLGNDYGPGGDVAIRLFHPQGGGRVFATWAFRGQENGMLMLNGQNVIVGSDWGIQVVFGNGVESPVRQIGTIANFDGRQFVVQATRIFGQ